MERLRTQLLSVGIDAATMTATDLRRVVYSLFLLPHTETDAIMGQWQAMVIVDPELAIEFGQARCLVGKNIDSLSEADRTQFFAACMDRRVTWGDEYALYFIERLLHIRCMVVFNAVLQTRQHGNYIDGFEPIVYVPLHLRGSHYETVSFGGQSAFAFSEIPKLLVDMAHRDCSNATQTYITLNPATVTTSPSPSSVSAPLAAPFVTHDHFFLCKPIADKTPLPVLSAPPPPPLPQTSWNSHASWNSDAGHTMLSSANMDIDYDERYSDDENILDSDDDVRIDVTGGSIYAGVMASRVMRLQCGISLPVPAPAPSIAVPLLPSDGFAVRTSPIPSRLSFKQPVYVW